MAIADGQCSSASQLHRTLFTSSTKAIISDVSIYGDLIVVNKVMIPEAQFSLSCSN